MGAIDLRDADAKRVSADVRKAYAGGEMTLEQSALAYAGAIMIVLVLVVWWGSR
ncbi:MAG: hypothetical protein NUV63_12155 [Gallionella sp.]|nr:hypothetical protein [Gallionella sp.]